MSLDDQTSDRGTPASLWLERRARWIAATNSPRKATTSSQDSAWAGAPPNEHGGESPLK
jgi:hypothetical protein